jgi:hypothetical protein
VPFYEAFAEWASSKVLQAITDRKVLKFEKSLYDYPDLPLNRAYLGAALEPSERNFANVDYTERGWHSLFNILTIAYLDRCDFNRPLPGRDGNEFVFYDVLTPNTNPEVRLGYRFEQVLGIFLTYPAKGIDRYMSRGELDFFHFLGRAGAVLPDFDETKIKLVKTCLNPNSTVNPGET